MVKPAMQAYLKEHINNFSLMLMFFRLLQSFSQHQYSISNAELQLLVSVQQLHLTDVNK